MRKVIYKEWVRGIETEEYKQWKKTSDFPTIPQLYVDGTNCYIEKEGLFHGVFNSWDYADGTEPMPAPMALIEAEDGSLMEMHPSLIRFIDSPEAEQLAEFAKAAMQGLLENTLIVRGHSTEEGIRWISEHAVLQAKSLIAELNKHEPIESTGYTTPYLRIEQKQAYERMKALGINIHAQTFEQCVNDLLYRLENNNSHEQA